jgi:alkylated DNA repair dioxygenase AlkB
MTKAAKVAPRGRSTPVAPLRPAAGQLALFGHEAPAIDLSFATLERTTLEHGAWIDVARGWLSGHGQLFSSLLAETRWRADDRVMYDRQVDVPRLYAPAPTRGAAAAQLQAMRAALDARYATSFERVTLALYRDGRDSVAFHGDYIARRMDEALVATVSVGAPRRFLLRPTGGGRSHAFSCGWGDLLVMGGSCQRTYQHAIPKVAHADPRIAIMFRPIWHEKPDPTHAEQQDTAPRVDR